MIKIFVSSTFKDMDYERDILHDEIVPELNEYASQYGEQVELCDLRWGIDTTGYDEVEGSKKILSVCLDEIERCKRSFEFLAELTGETETRYYRNYVYNYLNPDQED